MPISPDQLPDDALALKRIIAAMAQDALAAQVEIAKLRFQLARYRRAEFGRSSEKLAFEAEQLELAIEALEANQAERLATASPAMAAAIETAVEAQKPARRPLPEHLPREDVIHSAPCTCPICGGALRRIGADVSETLDYVPGRFKVIRHVRVKLSCRACDSVVAAPAPDHAIARGRAGAGLLAHIAVSKYDDHLPLYRQAEIFAREGVNLETSTLSGWVGATAAALQPLIDALTAAVMASDTLHIDDTPVPVLAPGTGKTKTGRLWTYVRDERPFAGSRPPAALFFYSPDRKGEHPRTHLKDFRGVIHADGYAGFNELFAGGPPAGPMSGESSSMCAPPSAPRLPKRRSTEANRVRDFTAPAHIADSERECADGVQNELSASFPCHPRVLLGGARSGACGFVGPFREPVVLTSHLVEVLFERGRRRISSQLPHARRVLAVVIRR